MTGRLVRARQALGRIDPGPPRAFTVPALALSVALFAYQLRSVFTPIVGEHDWRQSDTYAAAYNFVHESPDFFLPRIDLTHGRSGVMGMECPIYPYVASLVMRVFGDAPACARAVSWLVFVVATILGARELRPAARRTVGVGFVLMTALSPAALFEFRQIQPDPIMVALCVIAACMFHAFSKRPNERRRFVAAMTVYTAAVLTKSPALVVGPAMWLFTFTGAVPRARLSSIALRGLAFAVPIALAFAWQRWARHLNTAYAGGEVYFGIDFEKWETLREDLVNRKQLVHVFDELTCAWATNWTLYPVVLAGGALAFQKEHRPVTWPMLAWFLATALFLAAFSSRLVSHWYYALLLVPPMAYAGALAWGRLFDVARDPAELDRWSSRWVVAFLVPTFAATLYTGGPWRELADVPLAEHHVPDATWVSARASALLVVLALLSVALAFLRRAWQGRTRRAVVVGLFALTAVVTLVRGVHDEVEAFRYRARADEWDTFERDWGPLRRACDAVSTRADVFVVDGGQPWYLHRAMRRGFAEHADHVDDRGLAWFIERGARFYVHYADNGAPPHALDAFTPIAHGEKWALYRLTPP